MLVIEINSASYDIGDGCYGKIKDRTNAGAYLILDNGELAFAYKFNLLPGTKVLCTVLKPTTETRFKLVSIDSVLYNAVA